MPARKATQPRDAPQFAKQQQRLNAAVLERARGNEQVARIELAGAKRRLLLAADEYARKQDQADRCTAELRMLEARYKK